MNNQGLTVLELRLKNNGNLVFTKVYGKEGTLISPIIVLNPGTKCHKIFHIRNRENSFSVSYKCKKI